MIMKGFAARKNFRVECLECDWSSCSPGEEVILDSCVFLLCSVGSNSTLMEQKHSLWPWTNAEGKIYGASVWQIEASSFSSSSMIHPSSVSLGAGVFLLSCSEGEQISFLFDCIVRGIAPSRAPHGLRPALPGEHTLHVSDEGFNGDSVMVVFHWDQETPLFWWKTCHVPNCLCAWIWNWATGSR